MKFKHLSNPRLRYYVGNAEEAPTAMALKNGKVPQLPALSIFAVLQLFLIFYLKFSSILNF